VDQDYLLHLGPSVTIWTVNPKTDLQYSGFHDSDCPTMALRYSASQLLSLRNRIITLPSDTWSCLRGYGLTRAKPTARGKRAGFKHSIAPISTRITSHRIGLNKNTGVNFANLATLPDTSIPVIITTREAEIKCKHNTSTLVQVCKEVLPPAFKSNKLITFGLWNARSLSTKCAAVVDLVNETEMDLCSITETWLRGDISDNHVKGDFASSLKNFNFKHQPRKDRAGGGVACLIKKPLVTKPAAVGTYRTFECMSVSIDFKSDRLHLVTIYRPPPSRVNRFTVKEFLGEFSVMLELLTISAGRLLMVGDFNFHMDNRDDHDTKSFTSLLEAANLQQHVSFPTHRCGHTLDLVITRQGDNIVNHVDVTHGLPSDHVGVVCTLSIKRPPPIRKQIQTRHLRRLDIGLFIADLQESSLLTEPRTPDLHIEYDRVLTELLDSHAPVVTRTITVRRNAPWFNEHLHTAKLEKRQCERRWLSTNLEVHRQIFRHQCDTYYRLLSEAKVTYYREQIEDCDHRNIFKFIKKNFDSKDSVIPETLSADDFNKYFVDKIRNIRDSLDHTRSCTYGAVTRRVDEQQPNSTLCCWIQVTAPDVLKIIKESSSKSCSSDPLPADLMKNCCSTLLPVITDIVNESITSGVVPKPFKSAVITPLLKNSSLDPNLLANYRPVSNLRYISKVLERVVNSQLQRYLQTNKLYDSNQSAYRKHHSTETALSKVYNDALLQLDKGHNVALVMLDLSAAFDTVDHDILLTRLQVRYGICGDALKWIKSYLEGRQQMVSVRSTTSTSTDLTSGVPQGSVLAAPLFNLYMGPVADIISAYQLQYMTYADDTQIYINIQGDSREAVTKLEACLGHIKAWMTDNMLKLNDTKTDVILFASAYRPAPSDLEITIGQSSVKSSHNVKNLGIFLDANLSLDTHLKDISRKATSTVRYIGRIRKYLNQSTAERLVHAFITSRLDYCNSLLIGLPDYKLQNLQRLQNTAARIVSRTRKYDHITPVLQQLHWLPIKQRVEFKVLLLAFKAQHDMAPDYLKDLLQPHHSGRTLRSSSRHQLAVPRVSTNAYGRRAFAFAAPQLWNSIPVELRAIDNLVTFKSNLKTYLFQCAYE